MNVDTGIWNKLTKIVWILVGAAILAGVGIWYLPVIKQNERMRKEIVRLDGEVKTQEAEKKDSKDSIDTLQNDPKAVERLAREKFGYAKPGETVVRFEPPVTNSVVRR
jgi:cell division protein FtsB